MKSSGRDKREAVAAAPPPGRQAVATADKTADICNNSAENKHGANPAAAAVHAEFRVNSVE